MFSYFHIKTKFRAVLRVLVLCAVIFNVSVPAGAMLERSPDGTVKIVICSAQGTLNAWLDVETGQMSLQDEGEGQDDIPTECPMASTAPMAASDATPTTFITIRIAQPFRTEMFGVKLVIGQSPARLSARGPPTSI